MLAHQHPSHKPAFHQETARQCSNRSTSACSLQLGDVAHRGTRYTPLPTTSLACTWRIIQNSKWLIRGVTTLEPNSVYTYMLYIILYIYICISMFISIYIYDGTYYLGFVKNFLSGMVLQASKIRCSNFEYGTPNKKVLFMWEKIDPTTYVCIYYICCVYISKPRLA